MRDLRSGNLTEDSEMETVLARVGQSCCEAATTAKSGCRRPLLPSTVYKRRYHIQGYVIPRRQGTVVRCWGRSCRIPHTVGAISYIPSVRNRPVIGRPHVEDSEG